MTTVCKTSLQCNLANTLNNYAFTSTTSDNVVALAYAVQTLNETNNLTVSTVDDLPNLEFYDTPSSVICFITSLDIFAISSNKKWLTLDGRVLRDDTGRLFTVLYSWGRNNGGQLGDNTSVSTSSPVSVVGGINDWCSVSLKDRSVLAQRYNGTLWGWGYNSTGSLGDGSTYARSSPVAVVGGITDWVNFSAGAAASAGVRSNGTLYTWGNNYCGRLGDGTTTNRLSPVLVAGGFTDWCQVSSSSQGSSGEASHMLAVRSNGTAWAWGRNAQGQLGDGTTVAKSSPVSVIGGITNWTRVSAGGLHSVGLRADGTIWTWGWNTFASLGNNSTTDRSSPVSVVGGITNWCSIAAGATHTLALRTNGTLWAWGQGASGRLGDNNTTVNRSSPVSVVGGFTDWCQIDASSISAGVRTNGTVWTWGVGTYGGLGNNSTLTRASPTSVVGSNITWFRVAVGCGSMTAISTL